MIKALKTRYDAAYQEAHCTLEIYLNKPVAIGEHPQHLDEIDKLFQKIADAQEKLKVIEEFREPKVAL